MKKGSIKRYCSCVDPATGRQLASRCPNLRDTKHGQWGYRDRLPTAAGVKPFQRRSFTTRKAASDFRDRVYELLALARGDAAALARLGDLVFASTRRGGQLPDVADVRRRLGLGSALDRSQTVAEWLEQWFAGKRKLRESTARSYRAHLDHYLVPVLGSLPLDRLTSEHIGDMFDRIDGWNAEIRQAREGGRAPVLDGDVRIRPKVVGVATQRRVYATLRNAMNAALRARRIDYNPCDGVEMPAEHREPALVWSPEQVAAFLDATSDDRLHLLFRLVLLRGLRRGEAIGVRWADVDLDRRDLRVAETKLQLGGKIVTSRAKTRAGERPVALDEESATMLRRHRTVQKRERLAWGEAYEDNDLVFCREDGTLLPPDYVSRKFREFAAAAGLPVIKLHEGRHTAATLALEAGVDIRIVSEQLGHSTTAITQNIYQHVRRVVHDGAAEAVVNLLPKRKPPTDVAN